MICTHTIHMRGFPMTIEQLAVENGVCRRCKQQISEEDCDAIIKRIKLERIALKKGE